MYKLKTEIINGVEKIISRPKKEDARQKEYIVINSSGREEIRDKNWVRKNIEKIENVGLSGTSLYILNTKSDSKKMTILDYIEEAKKKGQKSITLSNITVDTVTLEILKEDKSKLDAEKVKEHSNNSLSIDAMKKAIKADLANSSFVCKLNDTCAVVKSETKDYGVFDVKANKYLKVVNALSFINDDTYSDFKIVAACEDKIAFIYNTSDGCIYAPHGAKIWLYKHHLSVYKIDLSKNFVSEIYKETLMKGEGPIKPEESMAFFFNKDLLFVDINSSAYLKEKTFILDLRSRVKHKNISGFRPNLENKNENFIVIPDTIQIKENNGNIEIKYDQERHLTGKEAKACLDKSLESIKNYIYDYECWQKSEDNMYSSIICYADGRPPKSGNYYSGEKPATFWVTYKDRYMKVRGDKSNRETVIIERVKSNNGRWKQTETIVKGRFKTLKDYDKGETMNRYDYGY